MQGLVRELNSEVESNDEDDTTAHGGNNTNKLQRLPVNAWDNETYSSHAGLLAATGVANVGLGEEDDEDDDEEGEADLNTVLNNNKKILSMEKFMSQRYQMRSPYSTLSMPGNNQQMSGVAMTTTTTPTAPNVLFRKNSQDTTTRLLQRQMMLNGSTNNTPNKINSNGENTRILNVAPSTLISRLF